MTKYLTLIDGWRRVTALLWETDRGFFLCLGVLTCLSGIVPGGMLLVGRHLIDSVIAQTSSGSDSWPWLPWLFAFGALSLAATAATQLSAGLTTLFSARVAHRLGVILLKKAASLDLTHFERSEFYDTLQRAQSEGAMRPTAILMLQLQLVQNAVSLVTVAAAILAFRWPAFVVLVLMVIPQVVTQFSLARAGYNLQRKLTTVRRSQQYYGSLLTTSEYIKEMILFRAAAYILSRYEQLFLDSYVPNKRLARRSVAVSMAASAVALLSYLLFYGYVLHLAGVRQITIGQVVLLAGSYQLCQSNLIAVIRGASGLYEHSLFLGHVWEFLDLRPQLATRAVIRPPTSPAMSLELRHVSFRYPGTTRWILRDVDLRLERNECVAVVGRNGCGKTTIAKLLCRMYDPDEGEIRLDGLDIRQFDVHEYRAMVSAVFQDPSRYHLSFRENVGISCHQHIRNDARVGWAVRTSGAASILEHMPDRYESMLGTYFGHGHLLSGGEWQKIAIARALMKEAPIIILDEPTVSLDPESEMKSLEMFRQLLEGRMSVLITHRLSHVRMANRIVVLDEGRVAEQGSHNELVRHRGWYAAWMADRHGMERAFDGDACAQHDRYARPDAFNLAPGKRKG